MGKKPVVGLAGLFLAGLALCGCQRQHYCSSCAVPSGGHAAAGNAWSNPPRNTLGQPVGGSMQAGSTVTSPGGSFTNSTGGFTTMGSPGSGTMGSSSMPGSMGTSSFQRPMGTSSGTAMPMSPTPSSRTGMTYPDPVRPSSISTPGVGTSSGLPATGSTVMPHHLQTPATSSGTLPNQPAPVTDGGSQSRYQQTTIPAVPPPSGVTTMPGAAPPVITTTNP